MLGSRCTVSHFSLADVTLRGVRPHSIFSAPHILNLTSLRCHESAHLVLANRYERRPYNFKVHLKIAVSQGISHFASRMQTPMALLDDWLQNWNGDTQCFDMPLQ